MGFSFMEKWRITLFRQGGDAPAEREMGGWPS